MPSTTAHPITFDPALLAKGPQAMKEWLGALRAFSRQLSPIDRATFLMALDSAIYEEEGYAAIAAGLHQGLHPKHALMRYHDFFVDNITAGERVIDLGCGVGALAASIAARSRACITGVDWSPENLAKARTAAANQNLSITYLEGDITTFRAPGQYDTIVLSNVLEHITHRPQRLAQWGEWYAPKRFLIRVPAFDRDWRVPWKQQLGVEWRLDPTHETEYTADQLLSELREANLTLTHLTTRWGEYWCVATT
ncbi:MAG TPA: class I SAM-dependent methyltransferase [Phycisphaerales bacterium]|nr:class I SAM-dependent methyltransferase [Phycisphaerales bacterium]